MVHVNGNNGVVCIAADGSEALPYCEVGAAILNAPNESIVVIHELVGSAAYQEDIAVTGTLAFFAANGETPILAGFNANPAVTVAVPGTLYMRGIQISLSAAPGFRVNGSAWVEDSLIINNPGGGIVLASGGTLMLENCFVGGNVTDVDAVTITDGTATILYSTLAGGAAASRALVCADESDVTVRNSLIVSRQVDDEMSCPNVTASDSAFEMNVPGNTSLGMMPDTSWFVSYQNADFHLVPGMYPAAIDTAGSWSTDDPTDDIDGDPRPNTVGAPDFAGADRIP
ncbi:hypothetical protein [Enhygromyxa salina]|uniref:hypothetical protein n=1 Tax=Enhygromyxa salina TaxID=215803 RepID=UPI0011BABF84|nr:hypothetical protein [Enhygromyxa salina]